MDYQATAAELCEASENLLKQPESNLVLAEHLCSIALIKIRAELQLRIAERLKVHHEKHLAEQQALKRMQTDENGRRWGVGTGRSPGRGPVEYRGPRGPVEHIWQYTEEGRERLGLNTVHRTNNPPSRKRSLIDQLDE